MSIYDYAPQKSEPERTNIDALCKLHCNDLKKGTRFLRTYPNGKCAAYEVLNTDDLVVNVHLIAPLPSEFNKWDKFSWKAELGVWQTLYNINLDESTLYELPSTSFYVKSRDMKYKF